MSSPFDDPEVRAQMARMGIAHQPGMAADLMKQLAPLLAEDGIDIDDLEDTDRTTFAAALERATERHNLELFTPIGKHRSLSLAVLRVFTTAIADDDQLLAQAVLGGVPRDETDDMPAGSHVIGTALGLLDTRLSDRAFASVRPRMRVPSWPEKAVTAAARDIVPLANKGRAFDSLNSLIMRHGSKNVMDGAALAVAAAIIAEAQVKGIRVSEMAEQVLPADDAVQVRPATPDAAKPASGSAFRRTPPGQGSDAALEREFASWMRAQGEAEPDEAAQMLSVLMGLASDAQLEIRNPHAIGDIIDLLYEVFEDAPDEMLDAMLFLLDDYLHFQLAVSSHPDAWEEAHDELEDELDLDDDDSGEVSEMLRVALERGSEVDVEESTAALLQLPIVQAVRGLLEWMGESRAITSTGGLRRADIAPVAALIGIDAVGVAKHTAQEPDAPIQVTSMRELTVLNAWWEALLLTDVIELTATRVRPGRKASEWNLGADPTRETADMLAGMMAAQLLTDNDTSLDDESEARLMSAVLPLTLQALSAEGLVEADAPAVDPLAYMGLARVRMLRRVGLAESAAPGVISVPAALVGTVARAVMMIMAMQVRIEPEAGEV